MIDSSRDLAKDDVIQVGDIFYNPDWEEGGPWFTVKEGSEDVGVKYVPGQMRPTRRPIEKQPAKPERNGENHG